MKTILILTHSEDDTANMVIKHLEASNYPFVRFDTDQFQKKVKMVLDLKTNGQFQGLYKFPDRDLSFEDVGVVWNRRVHDPQLKELSGEPILYEWALEESRYALYSSFSQFEIPVVNPWVGNEHLKYDKLRQLRSAVRFGFSIPQTRLTNDLESIKSFWQEVNNEMIFKKIRLGRLEFPDGKKMVIHTSKVKPETMVADQLHRLDYCPLLLEEHIQKKYDVRSVVVGKKVFSVAIHSQKVSEGKIDFRTAGLLGKLTEMDHEAIDLGEQVNSRIIQMIESFGLSFGAVDFIITPNDELIFLEINPNGQWAWLEIMANVPIAQAFSDHLASYLLA